MGGSNCLFHPFIVYKSCHRLDADAILSFAQKGTVIGGMSGIVADFATAWAATDSDYDVLATIFNSEWASLHQPVISRKDGTSITHTLYSGCDPLEPEGHPVECHGRKYLYPNVQSNHVTITCTKTECGATCQLKREKEDSRTLLGSRNLIKVEYPPEPWNVNYYAEAYKWREPIWDTRPYLIYAIGKHHQLRE